jgi:hypothetical protein
MGSRSQAINEILAKFISGASSITLLEFKATLIQECMTIHSHLRLKKRFTQVRDELIESQHRQARLRSHIFTNMLNIHASSLQITPEADARLAEKATLALQAAIPRLYDAFKKFNTVYFGKAIGCTRAEERPRLKRVAFDVNLPECRRGSNKWCRVEELILSCPEFFHGLRAIIGGGEVDQLSAAVELFDRLMVNPEIDLSHHDCRSAGDCLSALESRNDGATHALSTNARDWERVCGLTGLTFVPVTYQK